MPYIKIVRTFDPGRREFTPYGLSCEEWQPMRMPKADRHNEIEMNLLQAGRLTYWMGGRRISFKGGQLGVFWASLPHQIIEYENLERYRVVTVPLNFFLQWGLPRDFVTSLLGGGVFIDDDEKQCSITWKLFGQWMVDLSNGADKVMEAAQLEMQARLLRLAHSHLRPTRFQKPSSNSGMASELGKCEAIASFVATHYTEPLNLRLIGDAVGLHPNYAAGLFRRTFGSSLMGYVTEYRVSHAQRLLVMSDKKILDIALESGFQSLSRFNATFRAYCALTPREFRARNGHVPAAKR